MAVTSSVEDDTTCYDVFLSFRGEDTRHSFTDHLYHTLGQAGFLTFRDNDEIDRGQELKPEIERAIKASKASIVVLSENYATSTWCLDELWLILQQKRDRSHFVLPVFYHVDPSDVRNQNGTFTIQVKTCAKWTHDNVKRWKAALTDVANLTGSVLSGPETKFLKEIVDTIYKELDRKEVHLPSNLTGMDTRYEEITSWLCQSNLEYLVICGMGGSGKTTLAKYIYNSNCKKFENTSFVENIGRRCKESHDLLEPQKQLLKDILGGRKRKIPSVSQGTCKIEEALQMKRTLIVLDDIVEESQLVDLLGTGKINAESKIIITTENSDNWFKFSSTSCQQYKMKLLNDDESLALLSRHAFGSKIPKEGFKDLAVQAVKYCEGNPLALEVLGSSLSNTNTIPYWKSQLGLLTKDIHSRIQDVLKRGYDLLPYPSEKELFLHIACFFVGKDMDYVEKILEPDYSALSGIKTLIDRCLLSVSPNNKLMMHRLLQEMGRNIVREESFKHPLARSRVWLNADSYKILKRGKGSESIEGLTLDMEMLREEEQAFKLLDLKTDALEDMDKLKLLQLNFVELTGSHENFSEDLRWLCWFGFHLRTIPSGLYMGNVVAIDMSYSNLEVFEPPMVLHSLKILNLKDSHNLLEIRNMSWIPYLETLIIWNCHNLVRVCEIGDLKSLAQLNMTGCKNLCKKEQKASSSDGVTEQSPFSFPHSLLQLFLNHCNLEYTDNFPLSFSFQTYLQYLNLSNSLFQFLPYYGHLINLRVLDLSFCSSLKYLLCLPNTLAELYIYYCKSLEKISFQSPRFMLQEFGYEGCICLAEIEGFIKLLPIAKLDETDLGHLKWLKKYQNHEVLLIGDDELTIGRSSDLQMLYEFDIMSTSLPDIKDSKALPEYISESPSLSFDVPTCPKNRRLKGLNVTFKYTLSSDDWAWFAKVSTTNGVDLMYNPKVFGKPGSGEVGIWLSYWPIGSTLNIGDTVNVSIAVISGLEVHECGATLVYSDDEIAEESLENNMGWEEVLGGDLSGFQLSTGAYYLCRRDFFELMEVERLTPDWFRILVGDTIDYTEVRGWRKTGRPKQSNPSFTELKTVRCIIHGPGAEEIYNLAEMSKSSLLDKPIEFTSSILEETMKSGTTYEIGDEATKDGSDGYGVETMGMSETFISDKTTESASSITIFGRMLDMIGFSSKGENSGINKQKVATGSKLDAILGRKFKTSKFKATVKLAASRLSILKNKHQARIAVVRSDIIELLKLNHHEHALQRVDQVIKEQNMLDVFVMVDGYCHLLLQRVKLIEHEKECPDELKEAASSLIFAAPRCGDFPELQEIRAILTSRYGKEFANGATDLRSNCGVSTRMVQKLSLRQSNLETRMKILQEIATENGIFLQLEDTSPVIDEVLSFSESRKGKKKYRDVEDAAQAAFESAAYAAAAARAAVELWQSESNILSAQGDSSTGVGNTVDVDHNMFLDAREVPVDCKIPSLKIFMFADLKRATRNFSQDLLLGKGGFGEVFKGWVDENMLSPSKPGTGIAVAVKRLYQGSSQGHAEWQTEVSLLGRLTHPNIITLLGYSNDGKDEYLLVYEYMRRGSFDRYLFANANAAPLPWGIRLMIMTGVARGLAYLHSSKPQVIWRGVKSSDILLDQDFNAKLGDFGLAKCGPEIGETHATTRIMGTPGYIAPEYLQTGHLTVKNDIYGFGVVLLETLTGLRVLDHNRPDGQLNLVEWASPFLASRKKLKKILDPRIEQNYPLKASEKCAELTLRCLANNPNDRPSSEELLQSLEQIYVVNK